MFKERFVHPDGTLLNPKGELSNQQVIMHILSKMKREVPVHTDQTDDYGPQKVCLKCGNAVVEFEPEVVKNEVQHWDFSRNNYFPGMKNPLMTVRHYKEEEVSGWECPECGLLSDDQVGSTLDSAVRWFRLFKYFVVKKEFTQERALDKVKEKMSNDCVSNEQYIHLDNLIYMYNRSFENKELDMDDLREVLKLGKGKKAYHHNRKLIEENWLKKNAKVLKRIYNYVDVNGEDPETGSKVYTKARFNEEVNDDEGNTIVNETSASDIGIAYEEKTHESFARLCFWEDMVWMITNCPDRAYDKAISRMHDDPNEDIIHEEEAMWVDHVTGGVRNNGMMRFAQYQMMTTNKFMKNNPMFYAPKPTKEELDVKFDSVVMSVENSAKYKKYVTLSFFVDGKYTQLMKGKTASNWLNPMKLDRDTMNEAIDWARSELSKK